MANFNNTFSQGKFMDWAAFRETGADIAELAENKVFASGLTKEEFDALELAWKDFLFQLDFELPADKRKAILLETLKNNYQWEIDKLNTLEKEYAEGKQKDEPYALRRKIIERQEVVKELHKETAKMADELKRQAERAFTLDWLDPISHLEEIQEIGIEAFYRKRCALGLLL